MSEIVLKIDQLDFDQMYRKHFEALSRPVSQAQQWDQRATQVSTRWQPGIYSQNFLEKLALAPGQTVLDIGCGAGDMSLPIALQGHTVHALDFSAGMLERLTARARDLQIETRITTYHLDWFADWQQVPVCDVVIASRSSLVADMGAALEKLHRHARQRVYVTYPAEAGLRAGPEFSNAHVGAGRIPPYLYLAAILYQHGQWPELSYIEDVRQRNGQPVPIRWVLVSWQTQPWLA